MPLLSPPALCFNYCLNINFPLTITPSNLANQYNLCIQVGDHMMC